jgi:hypothetical protein
MNLPRAVFVLTIINLALLVFSLTQFRHAVAPMAAPILRAETIELIDASGKVRSRLNVEESGEVVFRLLDQDGEIRVKLGAGRYGSGLVLNNDATEPGVQALALSTGTRLTLTNKDGRGKLFTP